MTTMLNKNDVNKLSGTIERTKKFETESRCENPDCSAPTLISLVPTKETAQFVHDPKIIPNPVLVNGYTTVFQVDGTEAKVTEFGETPDGRKKYKTTGPMYRIVPNTHAHIINYVIVDAEGDTLRKISDNDPVALKKLLDSQINSAKQLLSKMVVVKKNVASSVDSSNTPLSTKSSPPTGKTSFPKQTQIPMVNNSKANTSQISVPSNSSVTISPQNLSKSNVATASKKAYPANNKRKTIPMSVTLPVQQPVQNVASNIKKRTVQNITSVTSGTKTQPIIPGTKQLPIISGTKQQPIIPGTKQQPIISGTKQQPIINSGPSGPVIFKSVHIPVVDKSQQPAGVNLSDFERMQAELRELRETVKELSTKGRVGEQIEAKKRKL